MKFLLLGTAILLLGMTSCKEKSENAEETKATTAPSINADEAIGNLDDTEWTDFRIEPPPAMNFNPTTGFFDRRISDEERQMIEEFIKQQEELIRQQEQVQGR